MTTMKSVSILGDRAIGVVEKPIPEIAEDQVLVRLAVSALCGSEMRNYRGPGHPTGGNSGHEAAGVVTAVGTSVTTLEVGDRVGLCAIVGCGRCEYCAEGRTTWCADRQFAGGMHSEYVAIAARACHLLPDDLDWATAVLITGDGLGVPFHSLTKVPQDARTVAVFGLGPVGLGSVLVHASLGRRVIGVDLAPERLALAAALGAETIDAGQSDSVGALRELTDGQGPDVCIEAAGSAVTARACFDSVRNGGTVIFNGEQSPIELSPSEDFIRRDITASGAWFYQYREYTQMLALVRDGLDVAQLVTHRFPIEDAAAAYREMDEGRTGKVLLTYPAVDAKEHHADH